MTAIRAAKLRNIFAMRRISGRSGVAPAVLAQVSAFWQLLIAINLTGPTREVTGA